MGASMTWTTPGLPATFTADGMQPVPSMTVYGCVTATHYFCASFQYYQGDNYSPAAYDYLYQGLLVVNGTEGGVSDSGSWHAITWGVGHLNQYLRIARYANNWRIGSTDIILSGPGNASLNHVYQPSNNTNGATLDASGMSFLTNDDFGYYFTLFYDETSKRYNDSTNAQLGPELLRMFTLAPIDFSVGVPQCSFLDLPTVIEPEGARFNNTVCDAAYHPVIWGDDLAMDYEYNNEGLWHNEFYIITLTPFWTGGDYSSVTQLAIAMIQNANVFAHIRMALYDSNNTLLMGTNEVTIDNIRDTTLYFQLQQAVALQPATMYYIAYWADMALYTPAGDREGALCYYGLQYGYDLQPWPATVGSQEAQYYECYPLPTAALGCTATGSPTVIPPLCPEPEKSSSGMSTASVAALVLVTALVSVLATLFIARMVASGKCKRGGGSSYDDDGMSSSSLKSSETSTSGSKYAAMSD